MPGPKCRQCGKSITTGRRPIEGRKYCSRECGALASRRQIRVTCSECGKATSKRVCDASRNITGIFFCSEECYLANKHTNALDNKETMQHLYIDEKLSLSEIAVQLGAGSTAVWRALREHNIPVRKASYNKFEEPDWLSEKAELTRLYWQIGWSAEDIAKIAGCSHSTVLARMKSLGVRSRTAREVGQSQTGHKAPNWKGGITPDKIKWMASLAGRKWTRTVYENGGYSCELCGKDDNGIRAHHIFSYADYPRLRAVVDNSICVCRACHNKLHSNAGQVLSRELQQERSHLLDSSAESH